MTTATINDFTIGAILFDSNGNKFKLISKYSDGVWESNEKLIFECEAKFYTIK